MMLMVITNTQEWYEVEIGYMKVKSKLEFTTIKSTSEQQTYVRKWNVEYIIMYNSTLFRQVTILIEFYYINSISLYLKYCHIGL